MYRLTNWGEDAEQLLRESSSVASAMALIYWEIPWVAWSCKVFAGSTQITFIVLDTALDRNKPTNLYHLISPKRTQNVPIIITPTYLSAPNH